MIIGTFGQALRSGTFPFNKIFYFIIILKLYNELLVFFVVCKLDENWSIPQKNILNCWAQNQFFKPEMTYLLSVKPGADYYPLPAPATMPSPAGFYPPTGHHTGTDFHHPICGHND